MKKYYLLYNGNKFLSMADSLEKVNSETEYYTEGTWYSYDTKEGSNLLTNEKVLKGIKFPEVAKQRNLKELTGGKKQEFKWVA